MTSTYSLIVKKILNINNNIFFNQDKKDKIDPIIKLAFLFRCNPKTKFKDLTISLESFLIKNHREDEIMDYFCKIQKIYHILNRFVFKYKYKKSQIVVNKDMQLNELEETQKNVICIYQENARYLFKIFDLLKIINMALIHSQNLFALPMPIKNPYNNIPFSKSILYFIYNYLVSNTTILYKIHDVELFFKFHRCHFNLTYFMNHYEYLLRENTILNNTMNTMTLTLYNDIQNMLLLFNSDKPFKNKIKIHAKFPEQKLVSIFIPYLILYNNSKYLLVSNLKYNAAYELEQKLIAFQKVNPLFGRLKIIYKNIINKQGLVCRIKEKKTYNDECISFYNYDNNFLQDHLTYTCNHSDQHEEEEDDEEEGEEYVIEENMILDSSDSSDSSDSEI